MRKNLLTLISLAFLMSPLEGRANIAHPEECSLCGIIKGTIRDLVKDNLKLAKSNPAARFQEFQDIQNPRSTMVLCSDSRVQVENFSQGAKNDIFVARNIGNQFVTTKGSVEYGVNVLKTRVLIFIGHSHCGAVKAAMGDYSSVSPAIQKELQTMNVKGAPDDKEGVILNVHNQVEKALDNFKEKVNSGNLAIIGAVYDFRNDYGHGKGRLIIVNLNGKKDPQDILSSGYFNSLENVSIGVKSHK